MPTPIAELLVTVGADVSQAISGLTAAGNASASLANQFKAAAPAALLLEGAAAGIGATLLSSIKAASDFEHQMSAVKSVMTTAEVGQFGAALDSLALKLGRDTVFTSRQAASAIEELIKAGIPAAAVLEGAGAAALNLAAATGVTTADAASIAAQAMNTFGLQAGNLVSVVDRLSAVANASASDVSFLRFGLAAVGGVAAGVGLSFDDTAVALGLLSNTFASGSDAGTSFKALLNGLIPDSAKQKELFKQLGLTAGESGNAFFDAAGHLVSLEQIAGTLQGSLSGLNDMQRQQALTTIFSTDGQRAANALFALGADKVQQFASETAASGAASRSAQTRLDNLQGAMNNLGGSIETVQIIVGRLFLPALRDIADTTRSIVDRFSNLSPETQRLAVFITGGTAAIIGLLGGFVLLGAIIPPLVVSFGALNAVLFANPIGLVVVALTALTTAAVILFNTNEAFRNSVLGAWDVLQNQFFPAVLSAAAAVQERLRPVLDEVGASLQALATDQGPKVVDFFSNTLPGALGSMATQVASLGPLLGSVLGFFGAINNLIGTLVSTAVTALGSLFDNVLIPGIQGLGAAVTPLQPVIEGVGSAFGAMGVGLTTLGAFLQPATDLFTNMAASINSAADAIKNFPDVPAGLPGVSVPAVPAIQNNNAFDDAVLNWFKQTSTQQSGAQPVSFTPGGGGQSGGPIVSIGQLIISSEAEAEAFLQRMAEAVRAAAGRVSPPVPAGQPGLVTGVV